MLSAYIAQLLAPLRLDHYKHLYVSVRSRWAHSDHCDQFHVLISRRFMGNTEKGITVHLDREREGGEVPTTSGLSGGKASVVEARTFN